MIDLAIKVQCNEGFDCVNVSSNTNYSVNEMYDIVRKIMGKTINAEYADTSHYWVKYPQLYSGAYPIRDEILNHEVNKYSLCDNSLAKEKYGWTPRIGIEEGLKMLLTMRYNCWQVSTHCMALDLIFLIFYFSLCVPLLPVNITK